MRDLALYRQAVSQVSGPACHPDAHDWHEFRSDDGTMILVIRCLTCGRQPIDLLTDREAAASGGATSATSQDR